MDDLPIITSLKEANFTKSNLIVIKEDYEISQYKANSNLSFYLKNIYNNNSLSILGILRLKRIQNLTDIDFNFCRKANSLKLNNSELCNWLITTGFGSGCFYHPKQLYNLYPDIEIHQDSENILVKNQDNIYYLSDFCKMIKSRNMESFLCDFKILQFPSTYKANSILIILFWGNNEIGNEILQKISLFKFKYNLLIVKRYGVKKIFKKEYFVIETKEFGNDIIPSLIGYNFANKFLKFNFILKLQTKSEVKWRNPLVDFFLEKSTDDLIKLLDGNEFICHPKFNLKISLKLLDKNLFLNLNWKQKTFPAGSIFFCKKKKFDNILKFIGSGNYIRYFTQNMYDNHYILKKKSGIHFLERLIGIDLNKFNFIKNKNLKYNLKNIKFLKVEEKKYKKNIFRYHFDDEKNKKLLEILRNKQEKNTVPPKMIISKELQKKSIAEFYKAKHPLKIIKEPIKEVNKIEIKSHNKTNKLESQIFMIRKRRKRFNNIKKENIGKKVNYYQNVTHCYGWNRIMSELKQNIDNKNILIIDNVENYFYDKSTISIDIPWIGFIHCPLNIPAFLHSKYFTLDNLLKNNKFKLSLNECSGLISFNKNICQELSIKLPNINIYYFYHPISIPLNIISENQINEMEPLNKIDLNNLVFLGQHLRKNYLMFKFVNDYKVTWLPGIRNQELESRKKVTDFECSIMKMKPKWEKLNILYQENEKEYFKILKENVVILSFYSSNANNSILDVISLKIPALIEYSVEIEEYLGKDYPGYFEENKLGEILKNRDELLNLIKSSYQYLDRNHERLVKKLSFRRFTNCCKCIIDGLKLTYLEMRDSNIYKLDNREKISLIRGIKNKEGIIIEYCGTKEVNISNYINSNLLLENGEIVGSVKYKNQNLYGIKNI